GDAEDPEGRSGRHLREELDRGKRQGTPLVQPGARGRAQRTDRAGRRPVARVDAVPQAGCDRRNRRREPLVRPRRSGTAGSLRVPGGSLRASRSFSFQPNPLKRFSTIRRGPGRLKARPFWVKLTHPLMTIASGTRLGPYEIVAPLGAGGMG